MTGSGDNGSKNLTSFSIMGNGPISRFLYLETLIGGTGTRSQFLITWHPFVKMKKHIYYWHSVRQSTGKRMFFVCLWYESVLLVLYYAEGLCWAFRWGSKIHLTVAILLSVGLHPQLFPGFAAIHMSNWVITLLAGRSSWCCWSLIICRSRRSCIRCWRWRVGVGVKEVP